jgi:flagellar biosynthesis chaperone FliJ
MKIGIIGLTLLNINKKTKGKKMIYDDIKDELYVKTKRYLRHIEEKETHKLRDWDVRKDKKLNDELVKTDNRLANETEEEKKIKLSKDRDEIDNLLTQLLDLNPDYASGINNRLDYDRYDFLSSEENILNDLVKLYSIEDYPDTDLANQYLDNLKIELFNSFIENIDTCIATIKEYVGE